MTGLCECGCGGATAVSPQNDPARGYVRDTPRRFIHGHHMRLGSYQQDRSHPNLGKRGAETSNWKGGRHHDNRGYMLLLKPEHPAAVSRYVLEHRVVMEDHLGRYLTSEETVHHKNGVRDDNRLENLELWSRSHPPGQRVEDLVSWAREILARYD